MDDEAAGVPEWVVTYGDMMSLLLTFFIMLVSLSEIVADQKFQSIMAAIQKYVGYRTSPRAPIGEKFPLNSLMKRLDTLGSFTSNRSARGGVRHQAPPGDDLRVFSISDGRATRVGDPVQFNGYETTLSESARRQLKPAQKELAGKPNKLVIVGHVAKGPVPASAVSQDKTLLSYLRAKAVAEELKRRKVDVSRIRILASADTHPPPEGGAVRGLSPHRVEIYVINKPVEHFQGDEDRESR